MKGNLVIQECFHDNFVGGVKHRGSGSPGTQRPVSKVQATKLLPVGLVELQF